MRTHVHDTVIGYGVTLRRLTEDKIETVRRWRNDPSISRFMEYREHITPEQQLAWFRKIDNDNNYYFIVEIDDKEIGLCNVKDIDYEKGIGEPGVFLWDTSYLNNFFSYQLAFCGNDFFFYTLGLKKLVAHVLKDNKRAIEYNKSLGYKLSAGQEDVYNQEYVLTVEDYEKAKNKIKKYL